jgi:hypothetical protein
MQVSNFRPGHPAWRWINGGIHGIMETNCSDRWNEFL